MTTLEGKKTYIFLAIYIALQILSLWIEIPNREEIETTILASAGLAFAAKVQRIEDASAKN